MIKLLLTISMMLAGSTAITAQDAPAERGSKTSQNKEQKLILASDSSVQAELKKTIDIKDAKVGDEVVLKTTKTVKQNGEVVIAKGTDVIGRITEVQRRTKDNATSRIGILLERVEGKDLAAPINASIVSIVNTAASASVGDTFSSDMSGQSTTTARSSSSGSGGGLLGGSTGGLLGGVGSTVNGVGSTVGGVVNTTAQTAGTVTGTAGQTVGSVASGLQGVTLTGSAAGSANGATTLSTQNKSLRLEKGLTFNLLLNADASN